MRRAICLILIFLCMIVPRKPAQAAGFSGSLSAESAVLLSAETGMVLYEKNAHRQRGMASTTKIMTALLALEYAAANDDPLVTVTEEMVAVEGSSMGLRAGDVATVTNLTAGLLAASGNDAANALALTIGGTQEGFAEKMNARAQALSLLDTHFVTPSGLDDNEHYSTAYDMAQLARTALQNEAFAALVAQPTLQVELQAPQRTLHFTNHNKLLKLYEGCIGVKTGYTKKSGRCLVSAAQRDGVTLIAVTLSAPDDWNDHISLLDYGFSQVQQVPLSPQRYCATVPVVGGQSSTVAVTGTVSGSLSLLSGEQTELAQVCLLPRFVYAPVTAGQQLGTLQITLGGSVVYTAPLLAEAAVPAKPGQSLWQSITEKLFATHG